MHELLGRTLRERRAGRDLAREAFGDRERRRVAAQLVDEPETVRVDRTEGCAGEQQLHRDAAGEQTRQALGAPGAGQEAQLDLRYPEASGVGRDAQVAGERELEPAAERDAVDGGDRRLGVLFEAVEHVGEDVDEVREVVGTVESRRVRRCRRRRRTRGPLR